VLLAPLFPFPCHDGNTFRDEPGCRRELTCWD